MNQSWRAPSPSRLRRRRAVTYAVIAVVIAVVVGAAWAVLSRTLAGEEPPDTSAIDTTLTSLSESEHVEIIGPVEIGGEFGTPTLSGVLRSDGTVAGSLSGESGTEMLFVDTGDEVYVSASSSVWSSLGVEDVGGSSDWVLTERGLVLPDRIVFTPSEMVTALSEAEIEDVTAEGEREYANGMRARMDGPGAVEVTDPAGRQFRVAEANAESVDYLDSRLDEALGARVELIRGPGGSYVVAPTALDPGADSDPDTGGDEVVGDDEDDATAQGGQAPTEGG